MGRPKCILGNNCPNQIAKRNIQFQLSEDDSDPSLKENCVFCGSYTAKKKKVIEPSSSPWSSSSSDNFNRMKRTAVTDIDSLCGIRSMISKKKKEDIDDRINFYKSQIPFFNKKKKILDSDSDSDDLSDSGVKSDYESPGVLEANKNGLNIRKGRIISRSPTPEARDESTNLSLQNDSSIFKSNGYNKNISSNNSICENSTLSSSLAAEDSRRSPSPSNSLIDDSRNVSPPSSPKSHNSPFDKSIVESDPFELDSDNETTRRSYTNSNNSKDLMEAGPSSRPDLTFESSHQSTPNNSYEAHHSGFKSRFMNLTYMPKHKVERLLFKSFKLQILGEFSSSSDEDEIVVYQPPKKATKRKRKEGNSAPVKDAKFTSSQKIGSGFYRWKKRRRFGNSWSDEDSNITYEGTDADGDGDEDDDDDEDDDQHDVQPLRYSNQVNSEHDYSTSEFNKIAEANIDSLAFETEKLNWDDTVLVDDTTMDSVSGHRAPNDEVITLDDSPQRFELPLVVPTDSVVTIDGSDSEQTSRSPENDANTSDHLYCVNDLKKEISPPKQSRNSDEKNVDNDPEVPDNPPVPQSERTPAGQKKPWECPICLESANGQEISATVCGHMFCRDCIESYLVTSSTCPTCRRELNKKLLITLYDM